MKILKKVVLIAALSWFISSITYAETNFIPVNALIINPGEAVFSFFNSFVEKMLYPMRVILPIEYERSMNESFTFDARIHILTSNLIPFGFNILIGTHYFPFNNVLNGLYIQAGIGGGINISSAIQGFGLSVWPYATVSIGYQFMAGSHVIFDFGIGAESRYKYYDEFKPVLITTNGVPVDQNKSWLNVPEITDYAIYPVISASVGFVF